MSNERILELDRGPIRDQSEIEHLLEEIYTPRGEEYVKSQLGRRILSIYEVIEIDRPQKLGVLKMVIRSQEVIVNDDICRVPDIEIDISKEPPAKDGTKLHSVGYFTVADTDLVIKVSDDARPLVTTVEEVEKVLLDMKAAIVGRVTELQNK